VVKKVVATKAAECRINSLRFIGVRGR
jgi:hypothetical protein